MKHGQKILRRGLVVIVVLGSASQALAAGLEFSFATSFLNNVFLWPFTLGGCL